MSALGVLGPYICGLIDYAYKRPPAGIPPGRLTGECCVPGGLVEPSGDARNDYLPRANKHTPSCAFRPLPSHFQTPIR